MKVNNKKKKKKREKGNGYFVKLGCIIIICIGKGTVL